MSAVLESPGGCVTFWDVSWEFYEQFLTEFDGRRIRHTYDDGAFEIMAPISLQHENPKKLISWLLQVLIEELDIPVLCVGSMTIKNRRKGKGIEPDECFYIAHEAEMRERAEYEPERDPPPDLAIEIDWASACLPRMPVYARLGVPEIWRSADEVLTVYTPLAETGEYIESANSSAFPFLPLDGFRRFVKRDPAVDETTWIRRFREWVRRTLKAPERGA